MRKSFLLVFSITVAGLLVMAACAPKASPLPPAPPPAATPTAAPPRAAPPPTAPEDAAWAKVVEVAKGEGKVVLYGTGFTGEYGKRVVKAFQDKYGIPVEFLGGRLSELGEKVRTEQRVGQPVADGLQGGIQTLLGLKDVGAQVKIGRSPVEEAQSLARGEFAILLPTDAQYFESILAEGGPVKPFVFEEAHHFAQRAVVMARNPAHPNAARVLANWMLSKEGQTVIMTTGNWYPVRKDVTPQLSSDIKALELKGKRIIHTLEDELYTAKLLREGAAARFFKK